MREWRYASSASLPRSRCSEATPTAAAPGKRPPGKPMETRICEWQPRGFVAGGDGAAGGTYERRLGRSGTAANDVGDRKDETGQGSKRCSSKGDPANH